MNLFELFVKIGAKDEASGTISKITSGLGKGLATAAKIGTAAVGAAATGIAALTKASVENYAEYEQLVGGIETLFEDLSWDVGQNAAKAFQTAGLSANEYMSTAMSFAASLNQSLTEMDGNIARSADLTDQAILDMADNANKMGSDMSTLQTAYAGFAKQNYTLLDNLKIGYGGTKEEMKRLIADAAELSDTVDAQSMSFANIVEAIHVVQTEMGITGTTANEAGATIAGSVGAMKSAWTNLITGLADGNADIGKLVDNLVTTIVGDGTENNLGVIGNVLPAIETALGGIAKLIEGAAPKIIEILPGLVTKIVPSLLSAATRMVDAVVKVVPDLLNTVVDALIDNAPDLIKAAIGLVQSLIQGIQDNYQILVDGAIQIVTQLATGILNMLPQIVQLGLDLIVSLANGIAESLPELIPTIMDVIMQIVHILTDPANLANLLNAALTIITELAYGLMDAIPQLVQAVSDIIINIADFLADPVNLANILKAAVDVVIALAVGLVDAIPVLLKHLPKLWLSIIDNFRNVDWGQLGRNLVDGFKNGISRAWTSLKTWFKNLFGDLIGIAKKILGIASPSKVFKKIGGFTAEGFGAGFEDEFAHVKDDMEDALNFDDASVGINASIRKVGAGVAGGSFGGTSIGNITINIDGAKYSDEQSLASAIALEIQNMTDRRAAVYA